MHTITVCVRVLSAGHDAVTELDDLGHADDGLGVVLAIRQQHQEVEDLRDEQLRVPATHATRPQTQSTMPRTDSFNIAASLVSFLQDVFYHVTSHKLF